MERPHRSLSLHHRTRGRRFYSRVARARLSCAGREAHLPPRAADRAVIPAGCPAPIATAPGTSRAVSGNVPYPTPLVGHGDVRIRLPLVPDGGLAAGNLARLSPRHRSEIADLYRHR